MLGRFGGSNHSDGKSSYGKLSGVYAVAVISDDGYAVAVITVTKNAVMVN